MTSRANCNRMGYDKLRCSCFACMECPQYAMLPFDALCRQTFVTNFKAYSESSGGAYGSGLDEDAQFTQISTVKTWLASGLPLAVLDSPLMKQWLHEQHIVLPQTRNLRHHIPFILEEEVYRTLTNSQLCLPCVPTLLTSRNLYVCNACSMS